MIDISTIETFIKHNNQFPAMPAYSDLWQSIKTGIEWKGDKCTQEEAIEYGKTHCNSITIYILFRARKFINMTYAQWVYELLRIDKMRKDGYMNILMDDLAKFLNCGDKFNKLTYNYNYYQAMSGDQLNPEIGYKIKVTNIAGTGTHFMPGYVVNGKLFLSDSSSRGIAVEARRIIPLNKFQWIQEV